MKALAVTLVTLVLTSAASAQQHRLTPCIPIVFDSSGSAVIKDRIPDVLPLCYSFVSHSGQSADIMISKDDKMKFSIGTVKPNGETDDNDPIGDDRQSYRFTTGDKTYRIFAAANAIHGDTNKFFTMKVQLH